MAVLDPFKPLSGALPTGSTFLDSGAGVFATASSASPYLGDPGAGWKQNMNEPPNGQFQSHWEKYSSNALGQAIRDIVNSGTVVLSASLSATGLSVAQLSAALSAAGTGTAAQSSSLAAVSGAFYVLSGNLDASGSTWDGVSASVGPWTGSQPVGQTLSALSSSFAAANIGTIGGFVSDFSPRVMGPAYAGDPASSWPGSGSAVVTGTGYHVASGSMSAALDQLWVDFYSSDLPSNLAVSQTLLAVSTSLDASASIWNSVSASFDTLSGTLNASASNWNATSASIGTLSGVLYPLSSSYYALSATYAGVSGAASASVATGSQLSSAFYPVSASVSGIFNSSSLAPQAIYLRSPNNTIWKLTIDNSGILSSSVA